MNAPGVRGVNFAAALLPASVRERYREQWLGELRDASEVGVDELDISRGAIVFAAGVPRGIPGWSKVSAGATARRLRWSVGLALSAAVLALSQFLTPDRVWWLPSADATVISATSGLLLITPIAAVIALVVVLATTGAPGRLRAAVGLLAIATVGVSYFGSADYDHHPWWMPTSEAARPFIFLVATVLFVIAVLLVVKGRRVTPASPQQALSHRLIASVAGGIIVVAAVIITYADSVVVWASHPVMTYNHAVTDANRADYTEWARGWKFGEHHAATVLGVFVIIGVIVACLLAASGLLRISRVKRTVAISVAVVFAVLLASGLLNSTLQFTIVTASPLIPTQVAWTVARFGLAVTVLVAVGRSGRRTDAAL